jgi:hypothetical protein
MGFTDIALSEHLCDTYSKTSRETQKCDPCDAHKQLFPGGTRSDRRKQSETLMNRVPEAGGGDEHKNTDSGPTQQHQSVDADYAQEPAHGDTALDLLTNCGVCIIKLDLPAALRLSCQQHFDYSAEDIKKSQGRDKHSIMTLSCSRLRNKR